MATTERPGERPVLLANLLMTPMMPHLRSPPHEGRPCQEKKKRNGPWRSSAAGVPRGVVAVLDELGERAPNHRERRWHQPSRGLRHCIAVHPRRGSALHPVRRRRARRGGRRAGARARGARCIGHTRIRIYSALRVYVVLLSTGTLVLSGRSTCRSRSST